MKNPGAFRTVAATIPFILAAAAQAQAPAGRTGRRQWSRSRSPARASSAPTVSARPRPSPRWAPSVSSSAPPPTSAMRSMSCPHSAPRPIPPRSRTRGGSIGARVLDLRGLGASRTLVLVDGKRFVASTSQGTIDTNLIPSILVDNVDIVTGGASAAYGSDAVAGVVNFALNSKLEGMRTNVSFGKSTQGDDQNVSAAIAGGLPFADGRGHFVWAGEFSNEDGLGDCYTRSWCGSSTLNLGNSPPGSGGRPANNITDNVQTATRVAGWRDRLRRRPRSPCAASPSIRDGTTRPFQYGELYGTNLAPLFMKGGEGQGENTFFAGLPAQGARQALHRLHEDHVRLHGHHAGRARHFVRAGGRPVLRRPVPRQCGQPRQCAELRAHPLRQSLHPRVRPADHDGEQHPDVHAGPRLRRHRQRAGRVDHENLSCRGVAERKVRRQQLGMGRLLPVRQERRAPGCDGQRLHLAHAQRHRCRDEWGGTDRVPRSMRMRSRPTTIRPARPSTPSVAIASRTRRWLT